MDPGSSNEIRLDIDPNAFQFALRDGTLTLVPRNTAAGNVPLLQPPPPLQQPGIANGAASNQLIASTQASSELALTLFYASQNNTLNEEQHRFLRQQLQQMRGSLEFYEQFVDQRRSLTAQRERGLQAGQQGPSSSNARANQSINLSAPSLATNATLAFNQASPFNPTMAGSGSSNTYPSGSSYQQGTQRGQTNLSSNQAVPMGAGSTTGLPKFQSNPFNAPPRNQFQQRPPAQEIQIPAFTQQVPPSNQRSRAMASSQTGLQSTNGTRQAGNNPRAPSGQYQNQDIPWVGPPSVVPPTAFIPNREASTSAQQTQQYSYAHLYHSQTPRVFIPSTTTSSSQPTQARISPISMSSMSTSRSPVGAGADALKRAQVSNSGSSLSTQAAKVPVTTASTPRAVASQSTPARAPQSKIANTGAVALPTASCMSPTSPKSKTPATAATVSPIKKEEGSMAKALLNLFGKRKATESSPSGEPASKRRATSPQASVPPTSGPSRSSGLSLGILSSPRKMDSISSAPMGVKEENPSNPRIPEISDTTPNPASAVPPVNSVLPFELGEPLDLPPFEHRVGPSDIPQPLFEVSLPVNSDGDDSNLPRIEVLSDDVSFPPLSRSPSAARQSSIPKNDAPAGLNPVDRMLLDIDTNGTKPVLQDGEYAPLTPAIARSPSEPLFLPLTPDDDDRLEGVGAPPRRMRDIMRRPRRRFLYVQVPTPEGYPNPIRYGPRIERAKKRKGTSALISSSDEQITLPIGPPRRALHDGYEQILRSEDAARVAPRSCQWISCEATLDSLQKLEKHVRVAHLSSSEGSERVYCRWKNCHMGQFQTLLDLSNHLKKHLVSQRYCMYFDCDFSTRSAHLLTTHIRDEHNDDMTSLKPFVDELLSSPPIPESLPHKIPALDAFGPPVNGHPNARLEAPGSSPPPTPQSFAIMPLSPTKHAHRKEDEKERAIDKYSFLDPLWPPMLAMDELSGYGLDIFETECSIPDVYEVEQRGASVDELLF